MLFILSPHDGAIWAPSSIPPLINHQAEAIYSLICFECVKPLACVCACDCACVSLSYHRTTDILSSLSSTALFGDQDAVLKAINEARSFREQIHREQRHHQAAPQTLEAKLSVLSNLSLNNGNKVNESTLQRGMVCDRVM